MSRYKEEYIGVNTLCIIDTEDKEVDLSIITNVINLLNEQDEKIKDLILDIENLKDEIEERDKNFGKLIMETYECTSLFKNRIEELEKSQKQLAIEELEKVYAKYYKSGDNILEFIDQRINALRGEK